MTLPEWAGSNKPVEDHTIQGSEAWLKHRKKHIGASDVPAILGYSPYQTAFNIWEQKTSKFTAGYKEATWAQKRGTDAEPKIRELYTRKTGLEANPKVLTYDKWDTLIASLDGLTPCNRVVEIKYPSTTVYESCTKGQIPIYYYYQVQAQMLVSGSSICDFVCYNGKDISILPIPAREGDHRFILEKCMQFWDTVTSRKSPIGCYLPIIYITVDRNGN